VSEKINKGRSSDSEASFGYRIFSDQYIKARRDYYNDNRNTEAKKVTLESDVNTIFAGLSSLLLSKHNDYGHKNVSDSPGGPLNGLLVRLWDKFARLNNLIGNKKKPRFESVEDTLYDIINYCVIAILVLQDKWGKYEEDRNNL